MSHKEDLALMAHLLRRAGFGGNREELERCVAQGYDATVEELLNPTEEQPGGNMALMLRYHPSFLLPGGTPFSGQANWMYNMVSTKRPLEEKIALFWHHVFATGNSKVDNCDQLLEQIQMFREYGLGSYRELLVQISKNPAMIFWLDNNENHKDEINENYGRELLELFSMGVGNYTEDDIKNASRSFTGWTFRQPLSLYPYGHHEAVFQFLPEDHDYGEKEFLGQRGNFDGNDIIDIIVKQPATARFLSRHLYNFFIEDEVQVPSWETIPPKNPEAIEELSTAFMESGGDMKVVLRTLFTSEFFKESSAKPKVKSPTELIVGVIRQTGEFSKPKPGIHEFAVTTLNGSAIEGPLAVMGQRLMNPPTVEGWHTGFEWIDSGTLSERVGFVEKQFSDPNKPGVAEMLSKAGTLDDNPEQLVGRCLDLLGALTVSDKTLLSLNTYAKTLSDEKGNAGVHNLIQMAASSVDYQFA